MIDKTESPIFSYHDNNNKYCNTKYSEKCFCLWSLFVNILDNQKGICECGARLFFKNVNLMNHPKGIDIPNFTDKKIPYVICSACSMIWTIYRLVKSFGGLKIDSF